MGFKSGVASLSPVWFLLKAFTMLTTLREVILGPVSHTTGECTHCHSCTQLLFLEGQILCLYLQGDINERKADLI